MIRDSSIKDLVLHSDGVVRGRVLEVLLGTDFRDPQTGDPQVFTDTRVLREQILHWKPNTPTPPEQFVVRSLGGEGRETSLYVPDSPIFTPGKSAIVFLSRETGRFPLPSGTFVVWGWKNGVLEINEDEKQEPEAYYRNNTQNKIPLSQLYSILKRLQQFPNPRETQSL